MAGEVVNKIAMAKQAKPQFEIPDHLKEKTQAWVKVVLADYELEQHQFMNLVNAGVFWDRAAEAREAIDRFGLTYSDFRGQPKARPEVAIERESMIGFSRCIRELGLPVGDPEAPGAPRVGGGAR